MSISIAFETAYQYAMEHVPYNPKWQTNKFGSDMVKEPIRPGSLGYSTSTDGSIKYFFIGTVIGTVAIVEEFDNRIKKTKEPLYAVSSQYRHYVCIPRELEMLLGVQSYVSIVSMDTFRLFFDPILKTTINNRLEYLFKAYNATKEPIGT